MVLAQLVSCGGDDAGLAPTPDASIDSPTEDAPVANDGAAMMDVGIDAADAMAPDAQNTDAKVPDGASTCPVSVPASAEEFFAAYAAEVCSSYKACCNTGPRFDAKTCLSIFGTPGSGGFLGAGIPAQFLGEGRIAYDPSAACTCLQAIATINCGLVPQQNLLSIQKTCLAALHGTVAVSASGTGTGDAGLVADGGSDASTVDAGDASAFMDGGDAAVVGCATSYECVEGAYCTVNRGPGATDAGLGICLPLVRDGGACTIDQQCSYLGSGEPSLYCSSNVCSVRQPAGTGCAANAACTSNVCTSSDTDAGVTCASGLNFATAAACTALTLVDAGDGG